MDDVEDAADIEVGVGVHGHVRYGGIVRKRGQGGGAEGFQGGVQRERPVQKDGDAEQRDQGHADGRGPVGLYYRRQTRDKSGQKRHDEEVADTIREDEVTKSGRGVKGQDGSDEEEQELELNVDTSGIYYYKKKEGTGSRTNKNKTDVTTKKMDETTKMRQVM